MKMCSEDIEVFCQISFVYVIQPTPDQSSAHYSAGPAVLVSLPAPTVIFQQGLPKELWPHNFIILSITLAIVFGIMNPLTLPLTLPSAVVAVIVSNNKINNAN